MEVYTSSGGASPPFDKNGQPNETDGEKTNGLNSNHGPLWAAPDLANKRYPVFPTTKDGKNPTVPGGFYAATSDHSQIADWIMEPSRKEHGVAFATGIVSGVIVIDADTAEASEQMREKYGEPTVISEHSHKGGAHWYFRHPRRGKVTSTNVGEGLDRKGDGGYVLAPPSKGKVWTQGIPDIASLPVLPEEFWSKNKEATPGERTLSQECKDAAAATIARHVEGITQGRRNEHMMYLCRALLDKDVSKVDAEDILIAAWEQVGGELGDRAAREVPNTMEQTQAKLENDEPTGGIPRMEAITPGLFEELKEIMGWVTEISVGPTPEERAGEAWEKCAELAGEANLTARFADTLHARGVAGESNQIRLIYLVVNSRRLKKPVNVAVKGASSSGKSYLVEQVLGGFPDSAYYALSAMSEKALIYLDEDMRHRFLVIYEASGMAGDMQTYLIRTLLSEGKIRYQTAESTAKGVKPRLLEMEGPTGLIVTTTQTKMHPENETRLFSLLVTDSREQTADILMAMADEDREPVSMEEWRALQMWLEGQPAEVYIHYAKELASLIPPVAVRLRRDFMAVLQLIRSHAILHQHTRKRDEKGRILASFEDYAVVRELVAPLVAEGVDATIPATVRETVDMVRELTEDDPHVSLRELANALELDKGTTSRRWQNARDAGYLKNLEDKRGKPAKISLGDPLPEEVDILPTLAALVECCSVAGSSEGRHTSPERCTNTEGGNKSDTFDTSSAQHSDNFAEYSENGHGDSEGIYLPPNDTATLQHPKVINYDHLSKEDQKRLQDAERDAVVYGELGPMVYVGRGKRGTCLKKSKKWHNPFKVDTKDEKRDGTPEECVAKFSNYLFEPIENYEGKTFNGDHFGLSGVLEELQGKTLVCHCAPPEGLTEHDKRWKCHAQALVWLVAHAPDYVEPLLDDEEEL